VIPSTPRRSRPSRDKKQASPVEELSKGTLARAATTPKPSERMNEARGHDINKNKYLADRNLVRNPAIPAAEQRTENLIAQNIY